MRPWLAVAATFLVVAVGATLWSTSQRPMLPERSGGSILRSSELTILEPSGALDRLPSHFAWEADLRATRYEVKLYAVDDAVLFEGSTVGSSLELPQGIAATLNAAVTYAWQVEAFDAGDAVVGRSQRVAFRVRP